MRPSPLLLLRVLSLATASSTWMACPKAHTLRIHDVSDKQNRQVSVAGGMKMDSEKTVHQYGDLEQSLKIEGDIPNLVLSVPEATKQHASSQ
jgi:hypothetical protein